MCNPSHWALVRFLALALVASFVAACSHSRPSRDEQLVVQALADLLPALPGQLSIACVPDEYEVRITTPAGATSTVTFSRQAWLNDFWLWQGYIDPSAAAPGWQGMARAAGSALGFEAARDWRPATRGAAAGLSADPLLNPIRRCDAISFDASGWSAQLMVRQDDATPDAIARAIARIILQASMAAQFEAMMVANRHSWR